MTSYILEMYKHGCGGLWHMVTMEKINEKWWSHSFYVESVYKILGLGTGMRKQPAQMHFQIEILYER